mmetsp:Transcript_88990/g.157575  ORF Transcript_88990/g.157575 Transcript_88990/m.157575 type:complete len:283 (-) Transcript_88990:49-897(-)
MSQPATPPRFLYPVPFLVRNTFIDDPIARPASLEGFLHERQAYSCPVSMVSDGSGVGEVSYCPGGELVKAAYKGIASDQAATVPATRARSLETDAGSECSTADTGAAGPRTTPDTPEAEYAKIQLPPPLPLPPPPPSFLEACAEAGKPEYSQGATQPLSPPPAPLAAPAFPSGPPAAALTPPPPSENAQPVKVLRLEEALGPAPDQTEALAEAAASAGSAGHFKGLCRPCAFYSTKGCSSGVDCQFCHLCEPGEKKRRQKAKRAFFGALAEVQRVFGGVPSS